MTQAQEVMSNTLVSLQLGEAKAISAGTTLYQKQAEIKAIVEGISITVVKIYRYIVFKYFVGFNQ